MATMDDIARELGITKGTVSKALSGAEDVSETTRKAVVEKAVELGYSRINRAQERPKLALFILNMSYDKPDDFGYDMVVGFRKMTEPAGYEVVIVPLTTQMQLDTPYDEYMLSGNYRGAFFLGMTLTDPWMKHFKTCRTPTVLYDNHVSGNPNVAYVAADNDEGMLLAVAHLKSLGHKRIGYLSSALGSYVYQQRYDAFFKALRENGMDDRPTLAGSALATPVCLQNHLPRLIAEGCTAIMCSHDLLASSLMLHCWELGLRVPHDVSIVGYDDIPMANYTSPKLTTVRQNRTELGKSGFYALKSLMDGVPISTFLLHPQLIERDSTAPAPETPAKLPEALRDAIQPAETTEPGKTGKPE